MAARAGALGALIGSAIAVGGLAYAARKRFITRKNPSGLAAANLSHNERRDAIADYQRRRAEDEARGA